MTTATVTLFHNPACGTSRNNLQLIRDRGIEPAVVEYLKTGWTKEQLTGLFAAMGKRPRELMRTKGALAGELGLTDLAATDDTILAAMVAHPELVERPIVRTPKATLLARPSERVLEALD